MYDFTQQLAISKKAADPAYIPVYRAMLESIHNPASSRIDSNPSALAADLLYILLDTFTIEEVQARCAPAPDLFREPTKKAQEATETTVRSSAPATTQEAAKQAENRPKVSKFDQYPSIPWKQLDNPLIRTADSIFSDRINCFSRLKELEAATQDGTATRATLEEIVETSVRLECCFDELRRFNDTGEFLGEHPFIAHKDERQRILDVLKNDPEAFFQERKNIELNITRYTSQINGKRTTEAQKETARANREKYQAKLRLFREVFAEYIRTGNK